MKPIRAAAAAICLALACGGCAVALPAVGTAAAMGIDYTAKNCPSKTFTCDVDCVHASVLEALDSMSMQVKSDQPTNAGYTVKAEAKGLGVKVEMQRLTPTTTRVGVDAAKNIILRDGATAREIVAQVERALKRRGVASEPPAVSAKNSPAQEPHHPPAPPSRLTST